jgi:hypothetical protein
MDYRPPDRPLLNDGHDRRYALLISQVRTRSQCYAHASTVPGAGIMRYVNRSWARARHIQPRHRPTAPRANVSIPWRKQMGWIEREGHQ